MGRATLRVFYEPHGTPATFANLNGLMLRFDLTKSNTAYPSICGQPLCNANMLNFSHFGIVLKLLCSP